MNIEVLDKDVAKEVLMILLYSNENISDSIPDEIYKNLTDLAADSDIDVIFEKNKNLLNQNISSKALDVFSFLYYTYVSSEEEQKEILRNWVLNDNI